MLRIGTDCSGIEAPIEALRQLKIKHKHVFSSEIDKYAIQSIKANYKPKIIFGDITKRNIEDVPDIDLYVCGFPCQSFSSAGKRLGTEDKKRGILFLECLKVIKHKLPKVFILENVKGLTTGKMKSTFNLILKKLKDIKKYNIYWKIMNTKDYGIPQSRPRVFIIGILKSIKKKFKFPEKTKMESLKNYIDYTDKSIYKIPNYIKKSKIMERIPSDSIFIDISFIQKNITFPNSNKYTPCLNARSGLINVILYRKANINEYLQLQGFEKTFKQVISNTQLKKQIGNSMSINVLKLILLNIFKTLKKNYFI